MDDNFSKKVYDENQRKIVINCTLCNKNCDTNEQFENHSKSKSHTSKVKVENMKNDMNNISIQSTSILSSVNKANCIYCVICDVQCNTTAQMESHKLGKVHIKKALKYDYKDFSSTEPQIPVMMETESTPISKQEINSKLKPCKSNDTDSLDLKYLLRPLRKGGWVTCQLCKVDMNNDEQYINHCNANKHQKKLKSLNISEDILGTTRMEDSGDSDLVPCDICKISIHQNNMDSHLKGMKHKEKLVKSSPMSIERMDGDNDHCPKKDNLSIELNNISSLKLEPRNYQQEVYKKSLNRDCVVFLPTGTGKTFVAVMLLLKMLEENPFYRVAFLVDKVLLVMQQHDFIKEQLDDVVLERFTSPNKSEERNLKFIALANEYVNTNHGCPIGDHDVIVATADLFRNLLSQKKLFWKDFSLIILDEAHHCVKDHPYNKLLQEYHLYPEHILIKSDIPRDEINKDSVDKDKFAIWKRQRCKIIGLTASPSGDLDEDSTYKLLETLLESLGGVSVVNVTESKDELNEFTSLTNIETRLVHYDESERQFRELISQNFIFLLKKFERIVNSIGNGIVVNQNNPLTVETIANLKSQLMSFINDVREIQQTVLNHILSLVDVIETIDSIGYKIALEKFNEIVDNDNEKVWFENNVFNFTTNSKKFTDSDLQKLSSSFSDAIINECKSVSEENRTILILVKERIVAHKLKRCLEMEFKENEIRLLLGHGAKGGKNKNKGMTVGKQKKALDFIRKKTNQIIVATSVADEGIDLPQCDLVIIINPPNSVQALVQIRGRARKKQSRLLMLCRDEESIKKLDQLKQQESNIEKSITKLQANGE